MKKMIKLLVLLCTAAPAMVFGATPGTASSTNAAKPASKMDGLFADSVVAKGKGVSVSRSNLDAALIGIKSSAAAQNRNIPPQQMAMLEQQVLQRLIQVQLLVAKATDADKTAGKELAEKRLTEIKTRAGSDENLELQLKSIGLTRDELVGKMTEEATAETVLKRDLKANVTDEEVKKYYEENTARFEQPEQVRAAHVLLMTQDSATGEALADDKKQAKKKQMDDILKRARAGEDFGKLAKDFSEDPGSKDNGGEYTFPRGQMVPEFEAAAFSLNTNQISDIVTTQFGYHIIKLYEKLPAKKMEFDSVKENLKEGLTQQALQKQIPDYMKKLEKEANVEILDEKLKPSESPAFPSPAGVPPAVRPGTK